jgi:hypothetical protein
MSKEPSESNESEQTVPKRQKRNQHPDRFYAEPKALDRIRDWVDQAAAHFQGAVRPTRNDLVNVILLSHADVLSEDELKRVWERCFSPLKFMKAATRRLEEALERGEDVTLESVIESLRAKSWPEPKKVGRPRGSRGKPPSVVPDGAAALAAEGYAGDAAPLGGVGSDTPAQPA